jgi:hypothetical protein
LKPTKQTHVLDDLLLHFLSEQPNGIRLTDFEKILQERLVSRGVTDYFQVGSRHTIIEALKRLQKQGRAKKDIDNRRYMITSQGGVYLKKLEVINHILASNYLDVDFCWNPTNKRPEMEVYNLIQGKETADNIMAFLKVRLRSTKLMDLEQLKNDVIKYALVMGLVKEKSEFRDVWKEVFKGVERITVVQTLDPQLLLERIEQSLG